MRLSYEQLLALTPGTQVQITWSGGNGPHEYFVFEAKYGVRFFSTATQGVSVPTLVEQVNSLESLCAEIEVLNHV